MQRHVLFWTVVPVLILWTTICAGAVPHIPHQVIAAAGGDLHAGNILVRGTIGQPVVASSVGGILHLQSGYWHTSTGVSGLDTPTYPEHPELYPNFPNPFNPLTVISFNAGAEAVPVTLEIFDIQGRRVRMLLDEVAGPGPVTCVWNGRNDEGAASASGVYFYRLRAAGEVFTRKMLMVR